jgi:hypothetical protein
MCIYQMFKNDIKKYVQILYVDLPKVGYIIVFHWSSVKEFSCLKAIDFALEAALKF